MKWSSLYLFDFLTVNFLFLGFFALDCHSIMHFVNAFYWLAVLIHSITQVSQLNVLHKDTVGLNQKLHKMKVCPHRKFLQSPCEPFMEHDLRTSALFRHSLLGKLCLLFHLYVFWMCVSKVVSYIRIRCQWLALLLRMCSVCVLISTRKLVP